MRRGCPCAPASQRGQERPGIPCVTVRGHRGIPRSVWGVSPSPRIPAVIPVVRAGLSLAWVARDGGDTSGGASGAEGTHVPPGATAVTSPQPQPAVPAASPAPTPRADNYSCTGAKNNPAPEAALFLAPCHRGSGGLAALPAPGGWEQLPARPAPSAVNSGQFEQWWV